MKSRVNTRRADLGLPQFDVPPAEPVFSPNPVDELVAAFTAGKGGRRNRLVTVANSPCGTTDLGRLAKRRDDRRQRDQNTGYREGPFPRTGDRFGLQRQRAQHKHEGQHRDEHRSWT